jgi:hypothetical protein
MIINLPNSYWKLAPSGMHCSSTKKVQMADELSPKPPGLGAGRKGSRLVSGGATGPSGRSFQLLGEFCCRFAAGATIGDRRYNYLLRLTRTGVYWPGGPAVIPFPGTELEPVPSRCRLITRVPATPKVEPIDGDFKLMHYQP